MMRAVRFESQLGFHIEAMTKAAIAANAPLLKHISVERIAAEFNRLLVGIDRRAGMQDFLDTRLFAYAPKLAPHQAALQQFTELPNQAFTSIASGWTALIFMLKVAPESFLPAWKQSNDLMGLVDQAVTLLRKMPTPTAWDLYSAGSAAVAVVSEVAALMDHQFVPSSLTTAYEALPIHSKKTLALTGRDLIQAGVRPGPAMGKILHQIEYRVVDGSLPNDSKKLLAAAIEMSREPS